MNVAYHFVMQAAVLAISEVAIAQFGVLFERGFLLFLAQTAVTLLVQGAVLHVAFMLGECAANTGCVYVGRMFTAHAVKSASGVQLILRIQFKGKSVFSLQFSDQSAVHCSSTDVQLYQKCACLCVSSQSSFFQYFSFTNAIFIVSHCLWHILKCALWRISGDRY